MSPPSINDHSDDAPPTGGCPDLVSEIAARVEDVRGRIAAAADRANRDPDDVRLIAVTKGFPLAAVRAAVGAGVTDLGENRVQELDDKASAMPGAVGGGSVRWHLVGSLQRNKARRAVELADEFHALDSTRLARELDRRAAEAGRIVPCFVQVNVSGEESKSGIPPDGTLSFLDEIDRFEHLRLVGLMTLAAPADDARELERVVRPQLRLLADLARAFDERVASSDRPALRLSMGMSGDFEVAVEEGATDVRLGTILFGERLRG